MTAEPICLPDWKRRMILDAEFGTDCPGCEKSVWAGDAYCPGCGANQADLFGRILAVPFPTEAHDPAVSRWSRDAAKAIRAYLKLRGWSGISVTCGRGTAAKYVTVELPPAHRPRVGSVNRWEVDHDAFGPVDHWDTPACAACKRRYAAGRHLSGILAHAFPSLVDRSDTQTDYFDFVYSVS